MAGAVTLGTIAALIEHGNTLTAVCYNSTCGHSGDLDLRALAERLGPDHPIQHRYLAPKLRCSRCGSRSIGLRLGVCIPGQTGVPGGG